MLKKNWQQKTFLLFVLFVIPACFGEAPEKQLDLSRCKPGDSIKLETVRGQGYDTLTVSRKLESGVCEVKFESTLEDGFNVYNCSFDQTSEPLTFKKFSREKCKKIESGNTRDYSKQPKR